jgi:phage protein D
MPAKAALIEPGIPPDYYAPNFKVEVEGRELDPEAKGDVLDVKVTMNKKELTGFDITVNNWDHKHFEFKYSDTTIFDVGNRVNVRMGYADKLLFMTSGIISALTPKFPESGSPTLSITGTDAMLKLRDRIPVGADVKKFVDMADWQIAQVIAARNKIDIEVSEIGPRHKEVVQENQDDLKFLMERAKRIDFDCYVGIDEKTGLDKLHFTSQSGLRKRVYEFEWGKNLISFDSTLSLKNQVSKVTVRGWDPRTKTAISYTAGPDDIPTKEDAGKTGATIAKERLADKQDVVVDRPVATMQEARQLAISLMRERAQLFVKGKGMAIGLPGLRPGDQVKLTKLGKRFDGIYDVIGATHTLNNSGYLTEFQVSTASDGGTE